MINEPRYASLSSGLLARKGSAKPAMRPQGFSGGFEDLGWNDLGHGQDDEAPLPEHVPSSIAALTPAPRHPKAEEVFEEPEVVAQQRELAETFESETEEVEQVEEVQEAEPEAEVAAPQPVARVVPLPRRRALPAADGRKAAFTLRLDSGRHLRLRLATAVTGQSAQQLVTGALDALLETLPEIEALAERVPPAKAKRS